MVSGGHRWAATMKPKRIWMSDTNTCRLVNEYPSMKIFVSASGTLRDDGGNPVPHQSNNVYAIRRYDYDSGEVHFFMGSILFDTGERAILRKIWEQEFFLARNIQEQVDDYWIEK